jgi:hypothetical protein
MFDLKKQSKLDTKKGMKRKQKALILPQHVQKGTRLTRKSRF